MKKSLEIYFISSSISIVSLEKYRLTNASLCLPQIVHLIVVARSEKNTYNSALL